MFSLLRDRNFRLLWLGQMASQFGDRLTQLVLVALVATRAPGSTLTMAKVLVVTSLPALLVNPIAGAYVDRWDRKRTMITCDLIRALTVVLLPWLAMEAYGFGFYLAIFLVFAVATFFVPARLSIIPDLAPSDRLAEANALFTASGMIGSTVILLFGALLIEWAGPMRGAFVNATSYLASSLFILPLIPRRRRESPFTHTPRGVLEAIRVIREIAEGIRELWRHRQTRVAAGLIGFLMAGAGASFVVGAVLIQQHLHSVTKDIGFFSLWIGIGMLLGSLAYGRFGTRLPRRRILGLAFVGCGIALWLFIGAVISLKSGVAASSAALLLGCWVAPIGIVTNTLVHEAHPERLHGRIFSSLGVVINACLILSMLVAGWLAERGGRGVLLTAIATTFALSGMALLCYTGKGEISWAKQRSR